ncbi:hydrogenase formation HypD protein [Methanosalsum zhilinae DSM 4017]|uniref:Hydrogenase formation HypD protein n=1 Tax=Methanosalsum zhilinae (strain DSM 4017 / NBRC 107636 / OCM 62 / WeN5) TaxID=679901 RepID=F7XLC2_METZD|nr:hydrogenase formation protein HypD [Methanosalsum zhilinae]AEH60779.1 hydrogenase formation HypD protein [Methanosalsum zhilinae DSM 4017]
MAESEKKLISAINEQPSPLNIMHVCGTHERTISKYGLRSVISSDINLLSGPGCPVCITPERDIDFVISVAKSGVSVASFGDMLKVAGSKGSLMDARSDGADIHTVYSIDDAIKIAENCPDNELVFFGIGFETTAPTTAAAILRGLPENFSIFTSHKLIPPAMEHLTTSSDIDGFLAPGHVSTIIGIEPYKPIVKKGFPVVVAGFEAVDVLMGVFMVQQQNKYGISEMENAYPRCVDNKGNTKAQEIMYEVFKKSDGFWRGFGTIKNSALTLKRKFRSVDASFLHADIYDEIYTNSSPEETDHCMCADIITARARPDQCPYFAKKCTPSNPAGPCMVSIEGTCYNWYRYNSAGGDTNTRIFTGT